jgi:CheY-like chemotaxis protein
LLARILTAGGYAVQVATSGAEAMQVVRRDQVDLLVLDLSMPEPDGFEILQMLRYTRPCLRILVVSGFIEGVLLRAAAMLGATATLNKVEAPERLMETVRNILNS